MRLDLAEAGPAQILSDAVQIVIAVRRARHEQGRIIGKDLCTGLCDPIGKLIRGV